MTIRLSGFCRTPRTLPISAMNHGLDDSLAQFAGRPLAEAFPYLILDARYERVREAGGIASQAGLMAIGIDWDGRRQVLAAFGLYLPPGNPDPALSDVMIQQAVSRGELKPDFLPGDVRVVVAQV